MECIVSLPMNQNISRWLERSRSMAHLARGWSRNGDQSTMLDNVTMAALHARLSVRYARLAIRAASLA